MANKNWFSNRVESEAVKDRLSYANRAQELIGILVSLLGLWFFLAHQWLSTGFFTSKFGQTATFLFYAPTLLDMFKTAVKAAFGRKNIVRPLDIVHMGLSFVSVVWLYRVFPFDFSHLADVLPVFLRFLLQWVSNGIARVFMVVAMIVTPIAAAYNVVLYVFVRWELKS